MTDPQKHANPAIDLRRIHLVIHIDEGREPQKTSVVGPDANPEKQDPWDLPVFSKDSETLGLREHLKVTTSRLVRNMFVSEEDGNNNTNKNTHNWKYHSNSKSYAMRNTDEDDKKSRGPVRWVSVRQAAKCPHLLDKKQLHKLRCWVPQRFKFRRPVTLFSTTKDGFHLQTLYHNCRNYSQFALIIRTDKEERFGAFIKCLESFEESRQVRGYCGTGETFVFSFSPVPVRYRWVGLTEQDTTPSQNMFISAIKNSFIIGGGDGYAIQLGSDLERGYTGMCDTFYNPILCQDVHFRCLELEVLGFRS